jgi:predicted anti-sigma-YlaC factor YlaD
MAADAPARSRLGGRRGWPFRGAEFAVALALLALPACSVRRFAADRIGGALAESGSSWGEDDDPRLIGDAFPFALKTLESLSATSPDNEELRLAACRGFATYAAGFVAPEAEALPVVEFERAEAIRGRALRLHLRALGYCRGVLERRLPGVSERLAAAPEGALALARREDVELLYWTAAAWGSAIALGTDRPELVADLPAVRALLARAEALDPGWSRGALDEAGIALDALPAALGGSLERARGRLERAVERSAGRLASPYVTWAGSAAVAAQDRAGFRRALEAALAVDAETPSPDRLANRIAQERARRLLARADELFYAGEEE